MNQPYYSDQAYIAESFFLEEEYIAQNARLAFFKINSYKLTLIKSTLSRTRSDLQQNLRRSLLNFNTPAIILAELGFLKSEYEN